MVWTSHARLTGFLDPMKATHPASKMAGNRNLVGAAIRKLRLDRKRRMSQQDLADKLSAFYGVSLDRSAIARIERGQRYVLDYELCAIATALGASPTALLPRKMPKGFESLTPR